jgi:hypothetical protein
MNRADRAQIDDIGSLQAGAPIAGAKRGRPSKPDSVATSPTKCRSHILIILE